MMLKCETTLCGHYAADVTDSRKLSGAALRAVLLSTVLPRAINARVQQHYWLQSLKFRHDSADSRTSLWTHICMFTYAVILMFA